MQKLRNHPILILLIVNILVGLLTFRDYGLSWDEPLFYDYADALRYAYSPKEWFSGNFNLENAYGSSGTDHANRGPAYIIIARPFVSIVEALGADNASAWHLINFLTFQLGVYLLYRLTRRYVSDSAALASAALFAWQPLLWGHAFINPKDMPFLVFFLGAVCFGFEMADEIGTRTSVENTEGFPKNQRSSAFISVPIKLLLASFFLGVATSIRVLGPLAGLLVGIYALGKINKVALPALIKTFAAYAIIVVLVALATWPYLWTNPPQKFIQVFSFMSGNPTQLPVLFNSRIYIAGELPRRYLPMLLALTLSEPVWPLFVIGLGVASYKLQVTSYASRISRSASINTDYRLPITEYLSLLLWFFIPFAYVLLRRPPMYDGYRHFLFILPPLFIFAGFAIEKIFNQLSITNYQLPIAFILLAPALYASLQLHPYQYAYYNSFIGGASGAFRKYETEYWLTCYKEAVEKFDQTNVNLFVKREPYIAAYYADKNISIRDYRAEFGKIQSGDFVLVNTRTNEDVKTFRDAPVVLQIRRGDAVFCEVKKIP